MPRIEFPENWDEMTTNEQDTFYNENARAPSGWDNMTPEERSEYFKDNCDCAEIIYNDIWSYLMNHSKFKQAYNIINSSYNLRSKKINNSFNHKSPMYQLFNVIFNGIENYDQSLRHYYNKPCKCSFDEYDECLGRDNMVVRYYYNTSCDKFETENGIIVGCFFTIMMNLSIEKKIKEQVIQMIDISEEYANILKKKLFEFKDERKRLFIKQWKGSDYYYKKLFYSSIHLDSLNIPSRILKQRYDWNFDTMIHGHPKASDGLFAKGINEFEQLMK
jgi:hypothetical protein